MTKDEFLSGAQFNYIQNARNKPYKFINEPSGTSIGSINYFNMHHALVTRVTKSYADCCTTVVGKIVKVRIEFKNLFV